MKKITLVVLVVVLALGILGVGYAKWSDTVTINGTVNTGTVKIGITDANTTDPVGTLDPIVVPYLENFPCPNWPFATTEKKDVASTVSVNNAPMICRYGGSITRQGFESITETITNAYPFYAPTTNLVMHSCGTIPVKVEDFALTVISDPNNILGNMYFTWGYALGKELPTPSQGPWVFGCGIDNLEEALLGIQLHEGDFIWVKLQMIFLETTPQGSNASFTIAITASQYNEVN